jgi:hypothetical protein
MSYLRNLLGFRSEGKAIEMSEDKYIDLTYMIVYSKKLNKRNRRKLSYAVQNVSKFVQIVQCDDNIEEHCKDSYGDQKIDRDNIFVYRSNTLDTGVKIQNVLVKTDNILFTITRKFN